MFCFTCYNFSVYVCFVFKKHSMCGWVNRLEFFARAITRYAVNVSIGYYREAIGLFNMVHFKFDKKSFLNDDVLWVIKCIGTCIVRFFICRLLTAVYFLVCIAIFLPLNCFLLQLFLPVLNNFSTFLTATRMHINISFDLYIYIVVSHKLCTADWSFTILLSVATILISLILQGGNVHKKPGPLKFCYWNSGSLSTDNFLKKDLLEAFLCGNDFDIVILGESHLTSNVDENDIKIAGYSFKRSDDPNDDARGGVIGYHKSPLPCIFKHDLTKLDETLFLQVKVGSKKMFPYVYIPKSVILKHKVEEFSNELDKTVDRRKSLYQYCHRRPERKKYCLVG